MHLTSVLTVIFFCGMCLGEETKFQYTLESALTQIEGGGVEDTGWKQVAQSISDKEWLPIKVSITSQSDKRRAAVYFLLGYSDPTDQNLLLLLNGLGDSVKKVRFQAMQSLAMTGKPGGKLIGLLRALKTSELWQGREAQFFMDQCIEKLALK